MRMMNRYGGWMGAALFLLMTPYASADGVLHARVSFEGGDGMIKGQADSDWSYATLNTLVLPGDVLWADVESTIEVEFSGGTFLRMADQSRAEVVAMPPDGIVRGWTGSFYVQRIRRSTGDFRFRTPAAEIVVDDDSNVRIDVVENGSTTVAVRWGTARVRTPGARDVVVSRGKRTYIDEGYLPSTPQRFELAYMDAFDEWNRQRAELLALGQDRYKRQSRGTQQHIGYLDLDHHGDWISVSGRRYWQPTRVSGYVPYRSGYWSYVPEYGHVWCGSYAFSYYTSHYGRWTHHDRHGWLWTYRDGWGPAWVAAARYGDYYVWSPLDYYNRPVHHSHARFSIGGVTFDIHSTNYVHSDYLYAGYNYIGACPTDFTRRYSHGGTRYAWNIYSPRFNQFPSRYSGYGAPVTLATGSALRDYSPRRVIRGYDYVSDGAPRARARATQLEQNVSRVQFSGRTSTRGVRTAFTESSRSARVRTASINPSNRTMSRSITRRQETTLSAPSRSVAPTGQASTPSTRSVRSGTPSATSTREPAVTPRSTRSTNSGAATRTTAVVPRSTTQRISTTPQRTTATRERASAPSSQSTPTRVTPTPRSVTRSEPVQRSTPSRATTPTRTTTPRVTAPPRTTAPSRVTTPRATTPRTTTQRPSVSTTTPRVSTPRPSITTTPRSSRSSSTQRTDTSLPRVYTPQQRGYTAPRQVYVPPQRSSAPQQRSVTQSAPSTRSYTPRQSAPSVRTAPAPTPRVSVPRSAPQPQVRSMPKPSQSIQNRSSAPQSRASRVPQAPRSRVSAPSAGSRSSRSPR